jgi:hypothetical protein
MTSARGDYSPLPAAGDDSAPSPREHSSQPDARGLTRPDTYGRHTEFEEGLEDALEHGDEAEDDESAVVVPGEDV